MTLDLDALERAARAATPEDGEWWKAQEHFWLDKPLVEADFIAALSPDVVLRLLARLKDAEADAVRYRGLKEYFSYEYPEQYIQPQPREFGIQWEYQDCTPARPSFDTALDEAIEYQRGQMEESADDTACAGEEK